MPTLLNKVEIGAFLKLFNRGGYVLDFSTNEFDIFTLDSIGVAVCEKYQMSKGKSLMAYIGEATPEEQFKLIKDLFDHYEFNYVDEYTTNEDGSPIANNYRYNAEYALCYKKCKEIMDRVASTNTIPLTPSANNLKQKFSSEFLSKQIDAMLAMTATNPTEAIGKAKELIESCCKTILEDRNIAWDKNWDIGQLVGETIKVLKLMPKDIPENAVAAAEMKALLGNLRAIAANMATIRNAYGSGHGKSAAYKGLEPRHAKLAVGSGLTLVEFLWETHEQRLQIENEF